MVSSAGACDNAASGERVGHPPGTIYSGANNDATGTALNGTAMIISGASGVAKAIGGSAAKSVPVVGSVISAIGGMDDAWHVYQDYGSCMAGTT